MGARNQKLSKAAFLLRHPRCCFCGGRRPAVERDHAPARIVFRGKHGPDQFEFPACAECNRAVALSEHALAADWLELVVSGNSYGDAGSRHDRLIGKPLSIRLTAPANWLRKPSFQGEIARFHRVALNVAPKGRTNIQAPRIKHLQPEWESHPLRQPRAAGSNPAASMLDCFVASSLASRTGIVPRYDQPASALG